MTSLIAIICAVLLVTVVVAEKEDLTASIKKMIADNDVMVFSKSYCPYCRATKQIFNNIGAKFKVLELDEVENGSAIQAALLEMTGQRTVPNVFVHQKHLGGNDATNAAYKTGALMQMLNIDHDVL
mmetsp:Transcript_1071/g.1225  ORF Transcript_1071/g.1225 Transcript_1071/m.1225 type:complete len:126 (-) Transcript_1071:25-402(-)